MPFKKKKISDKKLLVFQQQGKKKQKKCCSRSLHFFFPETHQTKHEPSPSASLFGRNKNRFVFSSQKSSSAHVFYITTTVESLICTTYTSTTFQTHWGEIIKIARHQIVILIQIFFQVCK